MEPKEFLLESNKKWASGMTFGGAAPLAIKRFSTGVFALDVALGGGWPFARIAQIFGPESSGKTTLAKHACAAAESYCHGCHRHKLVCDCKKFVPGRALFVDQEGNYDDNWARCCGMTTEHHLIARPTTAEQSIDLICAAIDEKVVDVIVLDSIAAMTPAIELEKSADEQQMGAAARLINKFCRKVTSGLIAAGSAAPLCLFTNQIREKIGVMFGNPETVPGGNGQKFASAIRVRLGTPKITDDVTDKLSAVMEAQGKTVKNKTYVPKMDFSFKLAVRAHEMWRLGEVQNAVDVYKCGKALGLCGHKFNLGGEDLSFKLDSDAVQWLHDNPEKMKTLWDQCLERSFA